MTKCRSNPPLVLLIYPPSRTQRHDACPLGIQILAAVLEQAHYRVCLLDANARRRPRQIQQIVQQVRRMKPDVIGMTLLTPLVREAYRLAPLLRETGAKMLAGGPHATILPEEALAHGFDAVVLGEGEPVIASAVAALLGDSPMQAVPNWVYRDKAGAIQQTAVSEPTPELDQLPRPARHLVNPRDYGGARDPAVHKGLFGSRGCPARCAYCAGALFGKRFRFRSAASLVDEMQEINRSYGTTHFDFMDDAMTVSQPRMQELCERLIAAHSPFTWSMMTRIDMVNEPMLRLARQAGCTEVDYGIESGHPETLRRIHKPHTVEMVRRVIPLTARLGIKPYVFFILGFPWETVETTDETHRLMMELAPHVACFHPAVASILLPFPGTEIYERYKECYHFENWWLRQEYAYDAPGRRHSYWQKKYFSRGTVLDADFFHYSQPMKRKITEVFRFMYRHSLNGSRLGSLRRSLLCLSERLDAFSPRLERIAMWPASQAENLARRLLPSVP
jgi:anaerobic magnesium-protoporphyrin IX monomethyl ester cyclase